MDWPARTLISYYFRDGGIDYGGTAGTTLFIRDASAAGTGRGRTSRQRNRPFDAASAGGSVFHAERGQIGFRAAGRHRWPRCESANGRMGRGVPSQRATLAGERGALR